MTISDLSIKNPVFAWMLMIGLILFGLISAQRMGISQLPDVDFPVVTINLTEPGASPETMETNVVDPIEGACTPSGGRPGRDLPELRRASQRDGDLCPESQY